jgi:hypothetical protein
MRKLILKSKLLKWNGDINYRFWRLYS